MKNWLTGKGWTVFPLCNQYSKRYLPRNGDEEGIRKIPAGHGPSYPPPLETSLILTRKVINILTNVRPDFVIVTDLQDSIIVFMVAKSVSLCSHNRR